MAYPKVKFDERDYSVSDDHPVMAKHQQIPEITMTPFEVEFEVGKPPMRGVELLIAHRRRPYCNLDVN